MWFEQLTGFPEQSPEQVRSQISCAGEHLTSLVNGRTFVCGSLETPSLAELRSRIPGLAITAGRRLLVREEVADVQKLHSDPDNAGALFQVASQFNLLEMTSPGVTPEEGVGIYEYDRTQGPACAIAAGAGTIYRNYFYPINGLAGQSADNQIDCLADLGLALGNRDQRLWAMRNGYALATKEGLLEISRKIAQASPDERDSLRKRLRIGIQRDTQVTLGDAAHKVSQVYCSALPVAYSRHSSELWSEFARLVLQAAYESTLIAGIINAAQTGNNRVYLTLLGGGAFGNRKEWIIEAIDRALNIHQGAPLEVVLVSYGRSDPGLHALVERFRQ